LGGVSPAANGTAADDADPEAAADDPGSLTGTGTGAVSGLSLDANSILYFELDGSGRPLEIHIDIALNDYEALYFDGALWTPGADYTARSGSTVLTVTAEKLAGLAYGIHEIAAHFTDNRVVTVAFDLRGPVPAGGTAESSPLSDAADNRSVAPAGYNPVGIAALAAAILLLAAVCVTRIRRCAAR
jgi:hypothetical protein